MKDKLKEVTVEAKTVQDAIKKSLKKLKLTRDQVEVNILEKEKPGFLGLGIKKAKVYVREKKWTPKPEKIKPIYKKITTTETQRHFKQVPQNLKKSEQIAKETLTRILFYLDEKDPRINIVYDNVQDRLVADFECKIPKIVIGREGRTLQAIQYLVTLITSRKTNIEIPVQTDTENYWAKYEEKIMAIADVGVKNAKRTGKDFRLRPMPPAIRRFVHKYLSTKPGIETVSEGEDKWRKVVIRCRKS